MNNSQDFISIILYEILIFGVTLFIHTIGMRTNHIIYRQLQESFILYFLGRLFSSAFISLFITTITLMIWAMLKRVMDTSISYKKVFKTQFTIGVVFGLIITIYQIYEVMQNANLYQTEP